MITRDQAIQNKIAAIQAKYKIEITAELLKKVADDVVVQDPVSWGMAHRALRGKPYRFSLPEELRKHTEMYVQHRPFLQQMLADQAPNKCYEKSRQCGASESSVTEVLWFLDTHPATKAIYVFPTEGQMQDFANSRIDPALDESDYMKKMRDKVDNVKMKKFKNNSFLFMRAGQTPRAGEGIDGDCLYIDEKDRMINKIEAAFEQSLSGSPHKIVREFSTPTLPGNGIDKSFLSSSQCFWHVKCDSGHRQTLQYSADSEQSNIGQNWDDNPMIEVVKPGTYYFKCTHKDPIGKPCVSQINRWEGEWVAKFPDLAKSHAGYHINQLSCVWLSADAIMQNLKRYRFMDLFYNYVLGLPYASNEGLITPEAIKACLDRTRWFTNTRRPEYNAVVAGIDWGFFNWCVVLGRRPDGRVEVCGLKHVTDSADVLIAAKEMAAFLAQFNPNYIVADLGYGRDRCMELQRHFPDRVYACTYSSGTINDKTFTPVWNETGFKVNVDRTAHLRNMLEQIKIRKIVFPGNEEHYEILWKHLLNLALIHLEEEEEHTKAPIIIEKIGTKGGEDHYAHALAYACLALEKLNQGGDFRWAFV
jgi:hypothetical protein